MGCRKTPTAWLPYPDNRPTYDRGPATHHGSTARGAPIPARSLTVTRSSGHSPRRPTGPCGAEDPRCPADLAAPLAFLPPLIICGVLVPLEQLVPLNMEIALLALAIATVAWAARPAAGALAVVSSCLSLNGIRLNDHAVLLPHPAIDIPVLLALNAVWLTVWAARETSLRRGPRPGRSWLAPGTRPARAVLRSPFRRMEKME